jgi:hypothetical protein
MAAGTGVDGVVSVVISSKDQKAVVMRGGVEIGSAPVRVSGSAGAVAYVLRTWDDTGMHWLKLLFAGAGVGMETNNDEGKRFDAPVAFRHALAIALGQGA